MNERLEREIELWKDRRGSYDEHGDISATARHFYNLALEDIRGEVGRLYGAAEEKLDTSQEIGYQRACNDIDDFIRCLKK